MKILSRNLKLPLILKYWSDHHVQGTVPGAETPLLIPKEFPPNGATLTYMSKLSVSIIKVLLNS